jgi:hypothetical protein
MELLTDALRHTLLNNGAVPDEIDHKPVVKFFTPDGAATWLLTEMYPDDQDILFGLCDLGLGFPELGTVSFSELKALRGGLGLPVERDLHFTAKHPLSVYAEAAHFAGCITIETHQLEVAAQRLAAQKARG